MASLVASPVPIELGRPMLLNVLTLRTPPEIVTGPLKVLRPVSWRVPRPDLVMPKVLAPSSITFEKTTALPAVVAPTPTLRVRLPVRVVGPANVSVCSGLAVGKVVSASIVTGFAMVTAALVVARMLPPSSEIVPVPNGPLVIVPGTAGVELMFGTMMPEPVPTKVLPPE